MTRRPTTPDPDLNPPSEHVEPAPRRPAGLTLVVVALALQIAVAALALTEPRPARYGWQMYSAVPYTPVAWILRGDEERDLAVNDLFVSGRAEIDRVALLRDQGCDLVEADEIRFQLPDGRSETVMCR